jgi:hypothetical protein
MYQAPRVVSNTDYRERISFVSAFSRALLFSPNLFALHKCLNTSR